MRTLNVRLCGDAMFPHMIRNLMTAQRRSFHGLRIKLADAPGAKIVA
ncbi:MAG: hypothetical protein AB7V13_18415 [Pseudorhodoplanes sp.]